MGKQREIELVGACQDGADFYTDCGDEADDFRIVSYPHLVKGDYDMAGAQKAREQFAKDYPSYVVLQ